MVLDNNNKQFAQGDRTILIILIANCKKNFVYVYFMAWAKRQQSIIVFWTNMKLILTEQFAQLT